ncbi:MAG: hypothetical protein ABIS08_09465 [Pseudolysinimonas sp.]
MHPSFEQFVAALRDPAQRPGIGLSISDEDASTLLTNATWANDYYGRWIALFPTVVAAPAPSPAPAPVPSPSPAQSPSPFGPPPSVAADAQVWAALPKRTLPAPARIAIITVLTLVALSVVAGVINGVRAVTRAPQATSATAPAGVAPPSSGASASGQGDPVVFHGLTQTEYDLLEAVLAPKGETLEQAVAQGADDAQLQRVAVNAESSMAKTCREGEAIDNGFHNVTYRAAFLATYVATQKVTPAQAVVVYDAVAAYCDAH